MTSYPPPGPPAPIGPHGYGSDGPSPVCTWHPDRATGLSCTRCGRPACPECLTPAAVGFLCRACVAESQAASRAAAPRTISGTRTVSGAAHGVAPLITYLLIAVNVAVFAAVAVQAESATRFSASSIYNGATLVPMFVAGGEWWRIVTSGFLHLSVTHIALNMLALYFIGLGLERVLGRIRYVVVYGLSLLGGSAAVMWFAPLTSGAAGASGAIFGLMGALLVTLKRLQLDLRQAGTVIAINVIATFVIPGISWQAHLGGLVIGALVGAAMVYPPAKTRLQWQIAASAGVLVALVALIVTKDLSLGEVVCTGTFTSQGGCFGIGG